MASLSKIIEVHSHPILPFGQGAPVGPGRKQPDWSVDSALAHMEEIVPQCGPLVPGA
jgi:hypothetical protein